MTLCGGPAIHLFSATELERLVCGNPILDFAALQANARYDGGYNAEHRVSHALSLPRPLLPCRRSSSDACAATSGRVTVQQLSGRTVQAVKWLWEIVSEFDEEEKRRFLKFFTGSDRAPIGGLGNLRCELRR
jgi:hypothetical protein